MNYKSIVAIVHLQHRSSRVQNEEDEDLNRYGQPGLQRIAPYSGEARTYILIHILSLHNRCVMSDGVAINSLRLTI